MDEIIDNGAGNVVNSNVGVTIQHVKVNMAGINGFQKVTSGARRLGQACISDNYYNIQLPGLIADGGSSLCVEFRRI